MSCISKILQVKGDKEFLMCENNEIVIEGGGIYRDYEYLITFVDYGHRCCYVSIPSDHPVYHSKDKYPPFNVHGGVTFFGKPLFNKFINEYKCDEKWIGFDAIHYMDLRDTKTAKKYFGEKIKEFNPLLEKINYIYNKIEKIEQSHKDEKLECEYSSHKSYDYMENECKKLIDQLIEIKNN